MNDADEPNRTDSDPKPGSYRAHLAAQAKTDAEETGNGRGPALLDWRTRWTMLTARQQLRLKQAGVVSVVGLLGAGLYVASGDKVEKPAATPASKLEMGAGLRGDSLEVKLRGDLKKILDGQTLLGDRVTAIEEGKIVLGGAKVDGTDLPPALSGSVPTFPEPPATGDAAAKVPEPPAIPSAPPAPPAPPVKRRWARSVRRPARWSVDIN